MKTITLSEYVIQQLLRRQDILREFPHLAAASRNLKSRNKRSCCGRSAASTPILKQIKLNLIGMPGDRLLRLKQMLKADYLVAYLPGKNGPTKIQL